MEAPFSSPNPYAFDEVPDRSENEQDGVELRPLNESLTVEKIQEMRRKRQSTKIMQSTLMYKAPRRQTDEELRNEDCRRLLRLAKQPYRTGESILLAPGSANLSYVLEILDKAKDNERKKRKAAEAAQSSTSLVRNSANLTNQKIAPRSTQSYSRYDQELFVRDRTVEFLFDSGASFMSSATLNPVKPTKKQFISDECFDVKPPTLSSIFSSSIPLRTIKSEPRSPPQTVEPSPFFEPTAKQPKTKKPSRTPIIVVPGAPTSLMNIQNAREILEDMRFVETEEVKLVKAQRETTIFINRHRAHGTVQYQVINDVSRLSNDEMERIVAVFVHGPVWQFKGWNYFGLNDQRKMVNKWDSKPVNIFSDVQAFHIYYDDIKIEPNVLKWNVEKIPVSRMKRYKDKANLARIWEKIDKHIQKNRPWLRY